jgi:hypothetical protein
VNALVRIVVVAVVVVLAARASADPRKVYVMPVDGQVDAATRERLNAVVQKLASSIGGTVTTASTTYAETASMVGCDPSASGCSDTVLATLQADEIVWGTATVAPDGTVTLVTHRATKGAPPNDHTVKLAANASAAGSTTSGEPASGGSAATSGNAATGGSAASAGAQGSTTSTPSAPAAASGSTSVDWSHDKKLGVGLAIAGGAALVIGFALWASESSVQGQINASADNTLAQIQALQSLESTANGYAWGGNVMVIAGLAAGGVGAYYLWKDHKAHVTAVAVTPLDRGTGAALVVGGHW